MTNLTATREDNTAIEANVPTLLTVPQVCEILGIKKSMLYKLFKKRKIPFIKVGRWTRIEPKAVLRYIDRRRVGDRPPVF